MTSGRRVARRKTSAPLGCGRCAGRDECPPPGAAIEIPEDLPFWNKFKEFFEQLGVDIETDDVWRVRRLRGLLTHRRGELRTEALRTEFQQGDASDPFEPLSVEPSREAVLAEMDVLAEAVREVDRAAYRYTWGRNPLPGLTP